MYIVSVLFYDWYVKSHPRPSIQKSSLLENAGLLNVGETEGDE